jgi:hypothetical protein
VESAAVPAVLQRGPDGSCAKSLNRKDHGRLALVPACRNAKTQPEKPRPNLFEASQICIPRRTDFTFRSDEKE